ncbi:MAG TPA: bifunctional diaminohydroxyphosphoribosylaminopyrimidine deaminase/5-amino-6-(5-phosphoribosylamino)uracil reductase RibD [Gammaproteobacteria bacterium]|nr:bifunctional diaminohydroxyphosphoribosylaminopyrimidine deaminase/5-amino-6-(5-phosphoribosylamino)uracil reductase RibD [Gammaproteobacteria bacterium]
MTTAFSAFDHACMAQALQLAERGLYGTDPNPRVGCVIAKQGNIIGRGFHVRAGEAHAEVNALHEAGVAAHGADVFVTLEPCSHTGRTPPCVNALIEARVARVVAAMQDPNPKVAGSGFAVLREAGVEVAAGLMESQALALNPGFVSRMTRGRPWLRSKLAVSADGRSALANGVSKWISGPAAREDAQHWRARSSAILTGSGTVLADDPALTVRLDGGTGHWRQPWRVVLDSTLRVPATARVFDAPGQVWLATCVSDPQRHRPYLARGAAVLVLPALQGRVDPAALLAVLAERECNEVLVEAGAALNGALLNAGLLDELLVYMAPHLLGQGARGMFDLPTLTDMQARHELVLKDVRRIGEDVRMIFDVK